MDWLKYVIFAICALLTLMCLYFAWRFNAHKLTEREINLYSSWFVRIWFRYRGSFAIIATLMFGLMSVGIWFIQVQ